MGATTPSRDTATEQVRALMLRKENIEAELDAQISILKSHNCTMLTPLVDEDGFPRADIDVYAVRLARVRIIELRNDHKAILDDLLKGLQGVYNPALAPALPAPQAPNLSINSSELQPFARVDGVSPGSPAAAAGLMRDDLILSFGSLTRSSFPSNSLQPLAALVASQENAEINVKALRPNQVVVNLTLIPRRGWGGRGLLGCHIVPQTTQSPA